MKSEILMKTRREFLKTIPAGLAALSMPFSHFSCNQTKTNRPNVIIIMSDDQGYGDFGITGNPIIKTLNIDAMAKKSAQMTNFYVCPVCAPTRACLMTGRYNYRTRVIDTYLGRAMMEPKEVTMAEILKNAGYATGIFGKWHLGDCYPMRPQDQGFDEVLVHKGGGIGQPPDPPGGERKYTDPILFHNGQKVQEKGYCTDVYFNRGIEWMEKKHQQGQKFFMYLPTNAPHGPFHDVPQNRYEEYKKINLNNDQFPQSKGNKIPDNVNLDIRARAYSMISNIDDNVGKLLDRLKKMNILDSTIVIYMLDNGHSTPRFSAGLRGRKTSIYEGGIRSPLFFHWPEELKSGAKSGRIAAHIDILPTILEACQIKPPSDLNLDGRSFLPLLKNQSVEWQDREIVIQAHRGDKPILYHNFAIRDQQWKLLNASGFGKHTFEEEPNFELYNIQNDPYEMKNVVDKHPEIAERLKKSYETWFEDVSNTRPDNYAPPRIVIGSEFENPVILTRQDWRSQKGSWGADGSNGYWLLRAAQSGPYAIRVRFNPTQEDGKAELEIANQTISKHFAGNQNEIIFENIQISAVNFKLQVFLNMPSKTHGPWKVDVIKKND